MEARKLLELGVLIPVPEVIPMMGSLNTFTSKLMGGKPR
jgi:hypothetical protein